jgi:intein-encoded DNA endonuclease-like protein
MSENVFDAVNQQGSLRSVRCSLSNEVNDPSETTRRAPFSKRIIEAYLLGCLHDGTFSSNKRFRISQKGTDWLKFIQGLFYKLGYNSWIYKEGKDRDVYILETLSKFLDFKFNPLTLRKREEKIGYIRGFFDAEGGIPKLPEDRFYIQLVQSDQEKLEKIKKMLEELKINTGKIHNPSKRINPNYWRMYVLSNFHEKFIREIGSWHPRKIETLRKRVVI